MNTDIQQYTDAAILIVDDIEVNLLLLKKLLLPLGTKLIMAKSGAEALQKISNHDIAIALIDIHMPGMNGFELAQQIQKPATSELIPVIFITAQAGDQSVIEKYYSKGVVDFIVKPFQINILLRKVMVMLEMHQQKKQLLNQKAEMKLLVEELEITNQSLGLRLLYENLLVKVSEMAVSFTSTDHFFNSSLAEIGTTIKASRTYIIEYCSITQTLSNTFEWCAEGISAQKQNLQALPVSNIPWWHESLLNGQIINYYSVEDIPEQSTRDILIRQDISSILVVPLFAGNKYFGHVGFDFCYHNHKWHDMDVELLTSMSRILCSVIERNIAESENLKRMETEHALLNASLDSVFLIDANGIIIAHNEVLTQKLNLGKKDLAGKCIWDFLPSDVCKERKPKLDEVFRTGLPLRFEDTRAAFTFEHSFYPVTDALGKVYRVAVYGHDITERKQAEEALRGSSDLLDATQRLAKVGGWEWDVVRQKMSWTEETYRIHGFAPDEFEAGSPDHIKRSLACYDPDERLIIEAAFLRCVEKGEPYNIESPFTTAQGRRGWIRTTAHPVIENECTVKVIGNITDITDKRKAEEALKSSLEQLHHLSQYIEKVREAERVAISRDLHDDLGQALTAIKIDLEIIKQNISNNEVLFRIKKVSALVSETIKTVQRLTSELRPQIIDDLGLESAIEWYTNEFGDRTGMEIFLSMDSGISITADASLNLFRIMQESLTNIARHSRATRVEIGLYQNSDFIDFRISDNGIGITENDINSNKSFGIMSMKERAASLGGSLDVCNNTDRGTLILLTLPMKT